MRPWRPINEPARAFRIGEPTQEFTEDSAPDGGTANKDGRPHLSRRHVARRTATGTETKSLAPRRFMDGSLACAGPIELLMQQSIGSHRQEPWPFGFLRTMADPISNRKSHRRRAPLAYIPPIELWRRQASNFTRRQSANFISADRGMDGFFPDVGRPWHAFLR